MKRLLALVVGALVVVATVSPAGAQDDSITVTPADALLDGQVVEISATTTGSDYATLALCPAASAPAVGAPVIDLLSTRNICVGLVCLHDGDSEPALVTAVAADCPLAVQPLPISSVSVSVALPRVTNDGTDCAVAECVIVFNTWTSFDAQGAVSAPIRFDDSVTVPSTVLPDTTSTTVELSSPSIASTVTTTVATQVRSAQESNDGELAVTGIDAGLFAALGLALMVVGGAMTRARRD